MTAGVSNSGEARRISHERWAAVILDTLIVVGALAGSTAAFFRQQLANGFTVLISDRFDGIIATAILEHWFNVWRGLERFNQTLFFYPVKDTLGYNDGYFLYGCFYSVFRAAGMQPFLASEGVNICFVVIAFLSFQLCAIVVFGLGVRYAAFAAALFVLSGNIFLQAVHVQLLSVGLAPLLATLVFLCGQAMVDGRRLRAAGFGALAIGLHAAWLMSAFYMAWFFVFFMVFAAVVAAARYRSDWRRIVVFARRNAGVLAFLAVIFVVFNIPFGLVYGPKMVETGEHEFAESFSFVPSVLDVLNVGPGNLLFGQAYHALSSWIRPGFPDFSEKTTGFPPILLFLFALSCVFLLRAPSRRDSRRELALVVACASVLSWLCTLKIGSFTPWTWIYRFMPGARTVRVVARYQIFLSFPVTMLAVYFMSQRYRGLAKSALAILCTLLALEQINLRGNVALASNDEFARLLAVPPPPAGCRVFVATLSRNGRTPIAGADGAYSHNVDAMMIAEYIHLPTVNGMDSFVPPAWNLVSPLDGGAYGSDVRTFATAHDVSGLCGLDLQTMLWDAHPFQGVGPTAPSGQPRQSVCLASFDRIRLPRDLGVPAVEVTGWADRAADASTPPDDIYLQVKAADGSESYYQARRTARPDVAQAFDNPALGESGFTARAPTGDGRVTVTPVLRYGSDTIACTSHQIDVDPSGR